MLQALLLDLGDTLLHGDTVLPHVPEALRALKKLHTQKGAPLALALVSDYTPAASPHDISRLFAEYVALLDRVKLKHFFDPVDKHVTLSTQAGVNKPDPKIFRLALERLGLPDDLETALFITESAEHVYAAKQLGMTAFQFGVDFEDWSQAPKLVSDALAAEHHANEKYRESLEATGALGREPLAPGQTHTREVGPDGKETITRKRFSIT